MSWEVRLTRQAKKDIARLTPKLRMKLYDILTEVIAKSPYAGKKLLGELKGSYSYRLNFQNRIVYSMDIAKNIIYIERAKTHYGD